MIKLLISLFLMAWQANVFAQPFQLSAPIVISGPELFIDSSYLEAYLGLEDVEIRFARNGQKLSHNSPILNHRLSIEQDEEISLMAFHPAFLASEKISRSFIKLENEALIERIDVSAEANEQYMANGEETLIDRQRGGGQYHSGKWLGYQGQDVTIHIDLFKNLQNFEVYIGSLQNAGAWIFGPEKISLFAKEDHKGEWLYMDEKVIKPIKETDRPTDQFIKFQIDTDKAIKNLKIEMKRFQIIPDWHPATADNTWIFLDEIIVR